MKTDVIESELTNATKLLDNFSNNIIIFGSARINQEHYLAKKAYQLGKLLSDNGFNILMGAVFCIMQAANQGVFDGKSSSIRLNIKLLKDQTDNLYLDECLLFEHFFTKKVTLIKYADVCIFSPGGFGIVYELMEVLILVQIRKRQVH